MGNYNVGFKTTMGDYFYFGAFADDKAGQLHDYNTFEPGTELSATLIAHIGGEYTVTFTNGAYIRWSNITSTAYSKFYCYYQWVTPSGREAFSGSYGMSKSATEYYAGAFYPQTYKFESCAKYAINVYAEKSSGTNYMWLVQNTMGSSMQEMFAGAEEKIGFPGENSEIGGGTGTFDSTSDDIAIPGLPTLSAVTAGFITLFAPSISQLNSLASYMWSSSFDLDTFKKLFADPMDAIIGLSIVPVAVPVSGSSSVKIGFIDSGVSMNLASSQYVAVNCGTLTPSEYWGSALDYSPYTKFSIYLPYIGTRELNTDDIMGKTLQVVYNIDILSGACTAMIKCGGSVLYEFSGACATSIPVTGQNWTQLITSCIQLAGAGIAVAASGGSAAGLLPSTANAVMAMKPNIQRTGAVSGSAGMLGVQQPYLIWELPRQSIAGDYNKFVGYPSNITALLSTLTGYTQIESIHLENITATQTELAEIESLLKEGVII